ncbi:MAG: amino acid adenylation domain-containing protein [Sporichthyaceae bacterium]
MTIGTRAADPLTDRVADTSERELVLPARIASALLTALPLAYRASGDDVLLAGLALAVARTRGAGGDERALVVAVEGHGRADTGADGPDRSAAVGWFTSLHPVRLPIDALCASGPQGLREVLRTVKEARRALPGGTDGLTYGLVRYLDPDTRERLGALPAPEVVLNYYGRVAETGVDTASHPPGFFEPVGDLDDLVPPESPPDLPVPHALEIDAELLATGELRIRFSALAAAITPDQLSRLQTAFAAALTDLAAHSTAVGAAGGLTPSDVDLLALTQVELDEVCARFAGTPHLVWPVTPLQEGLLFHAELGEATGVYLSQSVLALDGGWDPSRLRTALDAVIARHDALRAAFLRTGLGRWVSPVASAAQVPWSEHDLSGAADPEAAVGVLAAAEAGALAQADLARPPLLRALLLRFGPDHQRLILTQHHLLTDGWSAPILVADLAQLYAGCAELAPAPSFGAFLRHLRDQDVPGARAAWRSALTGAVPTLIAAGAGPAEQVPLRVESESGDIDVPALAAAAGLTPAVLVATAWAVVLARMSGRGDVVFGLTVSGRPSDLPDADHTVGLFINTVPARVRFADGDTLARAAQRRQQESAALLDQEFLSLPEITAAAGHRELFDTLLVVENYPDGPGGAPGPGLNLSVLTEDDPTHYPLTLAVDPGPALSLTLEYRGEVVDAEQAREILTELAELLRHPQEPLAGVPVAPALTDLPPRASSSAAAPPRANGELALLIAALMAEVLELPALAPGEDFFACGGHSLLAARLANRIRALTRAPLALRDVFTHRTSAALARAITCGATGTGESPRAQLRAAPPRESRPLSASERRLWFLHTHDEINPAAYHIPIPLRLRGPLDVEALHGAFADLIQRHETLRSCVEVVDGEPTSRIQTDYAVPLLREEPVSEIELPARLGELAAAPFDLGRQGALRAHLLPIAAAEHVLLLVLHHIAADEASDSPFFADLATAYAARARGQAPVFEPLPLTYGDYAQWQRSLLGDHADPASVAARQLAHWREVLDGAPPELALPADRARTAPFDGRGATVTRSLPAKSGLALRTLAREVGATEFMVTLAVVNALLTRLGAGTDIVVGTPVAGRDDDRLAGLVGLFVNSVPLRMDTGGDPSLRTLTERARDVTLDALAHADLPFEDLVAGLNPPRVTGRHPVFSVMVAHQQVDRAYWELASLEISDVDVAGATAKFDLGIEVATRPDGGLEIALEYALDRFTASTAERLADRLVTLWRDALQRPDLALSRLRVRTPEEIASAAARNDTASGYGLTTFPSAFARQVRARGEAVAAVCGERTLTYAELDSRSARIAAALARAGVVRGDVVAVLLARGLDQIAAVIAVMRAGAAYLCLDPGDPPARRADLLADSEAVAAVSTGALRSLLGTVPVICLDDPQPQPQPQPQPPVALSPLDGAYLVYTSGTTGKAKAVLVPHEGVAKLIATQELRLGLGPASVVSQFASFAYDVAFWELCMALLSGGRLVIVPEHLRLPDEGLACYLREHQVTVAALPPAVLATFPAGTELPAGATLLCGTEAVPVAVIARWRGAHRVLNCYGPTEACVNATLAETALGAPTVPIGVADPDVRAYVLDTRLAPVPDGVAGELYLGGRGLARGYLRQSALSAARFVADPAEGAGARMYRTGDLVRVNNAGELEYLGRTDDQLKVRGHRLEPAQVEAVLASAPGVGAAAVAVHGDVLLGYLVGAAGQAAPDPAQVRAHAASLLGGALVPSELIVLDALPRTAAGKLDRAALPAPSRAFAGPVRASADAGLTALVCEVMSEVVGRAAGPGEDFFNLGGHSLSAVRLVSRLRAALGREVSVREVFDHPTPAGLAQVILRGGAPLMRPPLRPQTADVR